MKIVIIQGAFLPVPPLEGGAVEKIWFRMGQEFAAAGHEVLHVSKSFKGLPDDETSLGVHYRRVKGYETPSSLLKLKWLDLIYSRRVLKHIPSDADIIVTNTFWLPVLLRGKRGRKVYVDVQRVPKGQMKFYGHTGRLRGCSPAIYESVIKELPASLHQKVSYVPNPVPFDIEPGEVKKQNIILFVGRIHPEKGVHVLIEAFGELLKEIADWKLVIVGPHETKTGGGGTEYLDQLKAASAGMPNVDLVGPVFNEEELKRHYKAARIFCYPAQDDSGDAAPVAPREAMAYGCIPIVSKLACFNDIISDRKSGIYFDQRAVDQPRELAAAFQLVIKDVELSEKLSSEAREVSKTYTPAKVAMDFLSDFEKLINEQ